MPFVRLSSSVSSQSPAATSSPVESFLLSTSSSSSAGNVDTGTTIHVAWWIWVVVAVGVVALVIVNCYFAHQHPNCYHGFLAVAKVIVFAFGALIWCIVCCLCSHRDSDKYVDNQTPEPVAASRAQSIGGGTPAR